MDYLTPQGHGLAEFTEKRSRFIGQVWPVSDEGAAREWIARTKATYHDARHNCWCYLLRGSAVRYSDDGEPQGTAGQPMLEVFRRGGVENVLCVVTRYFGGILLGAGGLTRAYARSAALALEKAGTAQMRLWTCLEIACPYGVWERAKNDLDAFGGVVRDVDYGEQVTARVCLLQERAEDFMAHLSERTAGGAAVAVTGTTHMAAPKR